MSNLVELYTQKIYKDTEINPILVKKTQKIIEELTCFSTKQQSKELVQTYFEQMTYQIVNQGGSLNYNLKHKAHNITNKLKQLDNIYNVYQIPKLLSLIFLDNADFVSNLIILQHCYEDSNLIVNAEEAEDITIQYPK